MTEQRLTVVTAAYNEADNLPVLYQRLVDVLGEAANWEWVVVDDHSSDATFAVLAALGQRDARVRGVRLARNFGSHTAIICGLEHAQGDAAVVLAADLQDPPEVIPALIAEWRQGAQVVWAVRRQRPGDPVSTVGFARLYYWIMRRIVGMPELPAEGADMLLVDRRVIGALRRFGESNVSLFALITWMGFRQASVAYDRQPRLHGRSSWTLEKKLKLVADSVTSFTYLPVRLMSYVGFVVALLGFLYAGLVAANALTGSPVEGWSSLMVVVLVLGGLQMLMMGVLGEYLWRALDEARRRPKYLIEAALPEREPWPALDGAPALETRPQP